MVERKQGGAALLHFYLGHMARGTFVCHSRGFLWLMYLPLLQVDQMGTIVSKSRSLRCAANEHNAHYLSTKQALLVTLPLS